MPSTYDSLLRLELQATGENSNTWGEKTNTNIELIADAIAGYVSVDITGSGNVVLGTSNAATDEARMHTLALGGTLSGNVSVVAPNSAKTYIVKNNAAGSYVVTFLPSGGSGVVIPADGSWYHVVIGDSVANLVQSPAVPFAVSASASPPLTFQGDPDTGFTSFAANTITAITGGTNALTIGTSTLTVFGSVSAGDLVVGGAATFNGTADFAGDLTIDGDVSTTGSVRIGPDASDSNHSTLRLDSTSGTQQIVGYKSGSVRWNMRLGDGTTESGSNAGSNFDLIAYDDSGSSIVTPVSITRSSGAIAFTATGVNTIQSWTRAGVRIWGSQIDSSGNFFLSDLSAVQARLGINPSGIIAVGSATNFASPVASQGVVFSPTGYIACGNLNAADGFNFLNFARNGSSIGSIAQSGGGTQVVYNTASDYRLKMNVQPLTDALSAALTVPVYTYNFKAAPDAERQMGVFAHELQAVVPGAVTGDKDGEDMQQVDYSKLVPLLLASIQELSAKVSQLESDLAECKTKL